MSFMAYFCQKKVMLNLKEFQLIYSRYQSSGLKVCDFCANEVINEAKFYYWQKKLRKQTSPIKSFVPIVLDTSNPPSPLSRITDEVGPNPSDVLHSECEILYPWGTTFRLKGAINPELLKMLIQLTH